MASYNTSSILHKFWCGENVKYTRRRYLGTPVPRSTASCINFWCGGEKKNKIQDENIPEGCILEHHQLTASCINSEYGGKTQDEIIPEGGIR